MTLAWFVGDACVFAGVSPSSWSDLPQEEQIRIIRLWETHVGAKDDYVKRANFQPEKKQMELRQDKPQNLPYDDFAKLDIRTGTVIAAEQVPKSKLLKLRVSFGDSGERTVLAGIGKHFKPEEIVGTTIVAVLNLAPREMKGIVSEAMLLAASNQDGSQLHLVQCPGSVEGREVG